MVIGAGCSFALLAMGYRWAMSAMIACVSIGVWLGFTAWVFGTLRKMDDDRGRRGYYDYLNLSSTRESDRWHWVYTASTSFITVGSIVVVIGAMKTYVFGPDGHWLATTTDGGTPLTRDQSLTLASIPMVSCAVGSLFLAYTQREKGRVLVRTSLIDSAVFCIVGTCLWLATGS